MNIKNNGEKVWLCVWNYGNDGEYSLSAGPCEDRIIYTEITARSKQEARILAVKFIRANQMFDVPTENPWYGLTIEELPPEEIE